MREIKFRAWDMKKQRMIYESSEWYDKEMCGKTIVEETCIIPSFNAKELRNCNYLLLEYRRNDSTDYVECTKLELQQGKATEYTGLKDKNGKEIFEGDLLRVTDTYQHTYPMKVIWDEDCWTLKEDGTFGTLSEWNKHGEVIGNIYENKELLKSNQKNHEVR